MPVYEYHCDACESRFELQRKFSDPQVSECPSCGSGPVHKLVSRTSFSLKGEGWYRGGYSGKTDAPKPACPNAGAKSTCGGCPGGAQ